MKAINQGTKLALRDRDGHLWGVGYTVLTPFGESGVTMGQLGFRLMEQAFFSSDQGSVYRMLVGDRLEVIDG